VSPLSPPLPVFICCPPLPLIFAPLSPRPLSGIWSSRLLSFSGPLPASSSYFSYFLLFFFLSTTFLSAIYSFLSSSLFSNGSEFNSVLIGEEGFLDDGSIAVLLEDASQQWSCFCNFVKNVFPFLWDLIEAFLELNIVLISWCLST